MIIHSVMIFRISHLMKVHPNSWHFWIKKIENEEKSIVYSELFKTLLMLFVISFHLECIFLHWFKAEAQLQSLF